MFAQLVNHNDDLRRLVEKGYAVAFDAAYLIVRDIPYLDDLKNLRRGAFVTKMVFDDAVHVRQDDHQLFFAGSVPYGSNGSPIPNLGGGPTTLALGNGSMDVVIQRSFSNKPTRANGFNDFFDKIESYVGIISGPAMSLHGVSPYTRRTVQEDEDLVFKLPDTMSSRGEIVDLSARFKDDVVAVIGLGGTGSYLLDFLVKTSVREIRAFDHDSYNVHTAFRSPGLLKEEDLGRPKAAVYFDRYENFRHGLSLKRCAIDSESGAELEGVTFAFVCVDKGSSRAAIFELLLSLRIPFIDVGMGLHRKDGPLDGMARMTYYSTANGEEVRSKQLAPLADAPDGIYSTNIQISELNALNASLAMIKFKQVRGFYSEEKPHHHLLFGVGDCSVTCKTGLG